MSKKPGYGIYRKILADVDRHLSGSNKIQYVDTEGTQTDTVFRHLPSPDELESLIIWLNRDRLPHA
jgi:hypothetical protein